MWKTRRISDEPAVAQNKFALREPISGVRHGDRSKIKDQTYFQIIGFDAARHEWAIFLKDSLKIGLDYMKNVSELPSKYSRVIWRWISVWFK